MHQSSSSMHPPHSSIRPSSTLPHPFRARTVLPSHSRPTTTLPLPIRINTTRPSTTLPHPFRAATALHSSHSRPTTSNSNPLKRHKPSTQYSTQSSDPSPSMSPSPQRTIRKTDVGKRRRIEKNIESLKQINIDYNNIVGHQAEENFNRIYEMITPIDLKINHVNFHWRKIIPINLALNKMYK